MEIEQAYQQKCLICCEFINEDQMISLSDETTKTLHKDLIDSILSQILAQHSNGLSLWHSDIICEECFGHFEEVHLLEVKLREQKLNLLSRFKQLKENVAVGDTISNDFVGAKKILNIPSSDDEGPHLTYLDEIVPSTNQKIHKVDDKKHQELENIDELVKIHCSTEEMQMNFEDNYSNYNEMTKSDENAILATHMPNKKIKLEVFEDDKPRIVQRTISVLKHQEQLVENKNLKEECAPEMVLGKDGDLYTCQLCEDVAAFNGKARAIMAHLKQTHDLRIYICDVCGELFKKRNDFSAHMDAHVEAEDGDFQCEVCNRIFNNLRLFRIHKRMHYPQNKGWTCDRCGKKYGSKNLLDEHMNTHTGYRPYICKECGKSFASKYTFKAHEKTHEMRPRPHKCSRCAKTFLSIQNLLQHEKTHDGIKNYVCHLCDKKFGSAHNLEVHSIVHTGYKPFICGICGKSFARKPEIRDHERTHTGERPYQCEVCGSTFSQRSNLQSHKRATHYDDKRYICTACNKGFKRRRLLEYHIKAAHTGERPFKCNVCEATFVYPEHFKKHRRIHTGEKPFLCEVCGKAFNSRDNRNAHRFVHSDKKPYECLVCGSGFMRKPLLYQHMQTENHLNDTIVVNQPRLPNDDEQFLALSDDGRLQITQRKISRIDSDMEDMEEVNMEDTKLFIAEHMLVGSDEKAIGDSDNSLVISDSGNNTIIINGQQFQFKGEDEEEIEEEEEDDEGEEVEEGLLSNAHDFEGIITAEALAEGHTQIIQTKDGPMQLLAVRIPNDNGEEEEAWIKILPDSTIE